MNNADLVAEGPNNNNNNQNGKEPKKRGIFGTYIKYGFMPGFGERFKRLGLQLGHFAYLLAMVYGAVRLIKPGHPVLNPANIGKFGFRDVISAAAENVIISKQTIDQVLIFGAVLLGIVMAVLQVALIVIWVAADMVGSMAQAQDIGSMFTVDDPTKDLGLIGLEMVFGTDLFGADAPVSFLIQPLHAMLAFFSYAMLLIAVFLLIYYVFVVVGEAAISGTPFGRRFNGFYAPIRLCLAFGLLIPVAGGLNVAQYTTLWAAKMGSNMATNAWSVFADTFMDPRNFIITPSGPYIQDFVGAVLVNELCMAAYNNVNITGSSKPTIERRVKLFSYATPSATMAGPVPVIFPVIRSQSADAMRASVVDEAIAAGRKTITVSWSSKVEDDQEPNQACGSVKFNIKSAASDRRNGADAFSEELLDPAILDTIRNSYYASFVRLVTLI
ncbi:MAG TPA: hypothetical protein DHW10_05900, partial [Rhodospirillaceae bacterium]|nr:hypothetical protein [Rhodospirillaceae bacterium]